jgi:hydrogenase maturation protein HypF
MAENEIQPPVLGISWDGTGYGPDKTIWGGEFLRITDAGYERFGHFRLFPLPGGEKAIKEPRRSAAGMLFEIYGRGMASMKLLTPIASFPPADLETLIRMLEKTINTNYTSSAGRIFDAVAALLGIRAKTKFEGQAAMELEFALNGFESDESYSFQIQPKDGVEIVDWEPMIKGILDDIDKKTVIGEISIKFHNSMTEIIVEMARRSEEENVVLSGGCFQNKYLTERAVRRLTDSGFHPYWHQRVPPNDGGISLGQIVAATLQNKR